MTTDKLVCMEISVICPDGEGDPAAERQVKFFLAKIGSMIERWTAEYRQQLDEEFGVGAEAPDAKLARAFGHSKGH